LSRITAQPAVFTTSTFSPARPKYPIGCDMMMGVAQVMGMNPTLRLGFSIWPLPCANASRATASGKNCAIAAIAVLAPTALRKRRRVPSWGNSARITAWSTVRLASASVSLLEREEPAAGSASCAA